MLCSALLWHAWARCASPVVTASDRRMQYSRVNRQAGRHPDTARILRLGLCFAGLEMQDDQIQLGTAREISRVSILALCESPRDRPQAARARVLGSLSHLHGPLLHDQHLCMLVVLAPHAVICLPSWLLKLAARRHGGSSPIASARHPPSRLFLLLFLERR